MISSLFIFAYVLSIHMGWAPGLRRGGAEAPAQNNGIQAHEGHSSLRASTNEPHLGARTKDTRPSYMPEWGNHQTRAHEGHFTPAGWKGRGPLLQDETYIYIYMFIYIYIYIDELSCSYTYIYIYIHIY